MSTYPAEPHSQEPQEDAACTVGDGTTWRWNDTVCKACDGTGSGYQQWLNRGKPGGSER